MSTGITTAQELQACHSRFHDWTEMKNHLSAVRVQCVMLRDLAPGRSDQFLRSANVELAIIERALVRLVAIAQKANDQELLIGPDVRGVNPNTGDTPCQQQKA